MNLGVVSPLNIEANDSEMMIEIIDTRKVELTEDLATAGTAGERIKIMEGLAALKKLRGEYEDGINAELMAPAQEALAESIDEETGEEIIPEDDTMDIEEEMKTRPFWRKP